MASILSDIITILVTGKTIPMSNKRQCTTKITCFAIGGTVGILLAVAFAFLH